MTERAFMNREDVPPGLPVTVTHWRAAGRDYGWPGASLSADFWIPFGRSAGRQLRWFLGDHDDLKRRVMAGVDRIAQSPERVACPRCTARVGERCRDVRNGDLAKHPHRERWTQVEPAR